MLRVGTLSKTLGALGGFVAGPARYTDLLVNRARAYIFTTASSPADAAAALAALRVLRSPEGDALRGAAARQRRPAAPRASVADRPVRVRQRGARRSTPPTRSRARGLLVPAIRPPTVPPGTSRLRVALSAAHTADQVDAPRRRARRAVPRPRR